MTADYSFKCDDCGRVRSMTEVDRLEVCGDCDKEVETAGVELNRALSAALEQVRLLRFTLGGWVDKEVNVKWVDSASGERRDLRKESIRALAETETKENGT